ncbi:Fructose-1-phosphate phosphatase YqaB [compost metagenome]
MTLLESSLFFMEQFGLTGPPERLVHEMNAMMEEHYKYHIPLKPGVKQYLVSLYQKGVRLCVATAADERLAKMCLARLGMDHLIEFILSCENIGQGKDKPDIFLAACDRFETQPQQCTVFEDALYAVKTAKAAGFYVVAVYDTAHAEDWNLIKEISDTYITDWRNLI